MFNVPIPCRLPRSFPFSNLPLMKLMSEITKDCLELPSAQRLKLARILMDVSEPDQNFSPDVESAWEEEITARLLAVQTGTARSQPAAEVFARLDQLYPA